MKIYILSLKNYISASYFVIDTDKSNAISENSEIWCQHVLDQHKILDTKKFPNFRLNDQKRAKY